MPGLIIKCRYIRSGDSAGNYMQYIATRDGVEKPEQETEAQECSSGQGYMDYIALRPRAERHGGHGLFSSGDAVSLDAARAELEAHEGTVWMLICSLRRSDAGRLGYDNAASWKHLIEANQTRLAEAMNIPPEQLRWYAAFHNEGHHPHIHLMAWSRDGVHGRLTTDGIRKLRSALTNVIFQDELWHLYEKKDLSYRDLVRQAQETMRQAIAGMEQRTVCDPVIEQKMAALAERLKTVTGKKQYGYLPKALKRQVDEIADLLAAQPEVAACYDAWNGLRDELEQYYTDRPRERQPLSQQKEFKAIRNLVVREAAGMNTGSGQSEPVGEAVQQEGQETSPAMALYTVRLLRQISAVFRDNARPPANPAGIRVESKRRQKLMEKRIAQGHKPDDHEVQAQNQPTM